MDRWKDTLGGDGACQTRTGNYMGTVMKNASERVKTNRQDEQDRWKDTPGGRLCQRELEITQESL